MFLIMKLGEDLKTWTRSAWSCDWLHVYIQNVWNNQVFKLFIDAYKKSYSYETLWSSSRDHVEFGRILIGFFKIILIMKLGDELKT